MLNFESVQSLQFAHSRSYRPLLCPTLIEIINKPLLLFELFGLKLLADLECPSHCDLQCSRSSCYDTAYLIKRSIEWFEPLINLILVIWRMSVLS